MNLPEEKTTKIHGMDVELMFTDDGGEDYVSHCHISINVGSRTFSGSLEFAETGTLEDEDGDELVISDNQRAAIREWAEENGY